MNSVNALSWNPTLVLIMESVRETERSFRVLILHPHASEVDTAVDAENDDAAIDAENDASYSNRLKYRSAGWRL